MYVTVQMEAVSLNKKSVSATGKTKHEQIIPSERYCADRKISAAF